MFTSLQCFASLLALGTGFGYMCLLTTLLAVAFTQFDKLKAAIMEIRQQHITIQHGQEDGQVDTIAISNLHVKLNACIRHHQEIME